MTAATDLVNAAIALSVLEDDWDVVLQEIIRGARTRATLDSPLYHVVGGSQEGSVSRAGLDEAMGSPVIMPARLLT